MNATEQMMEEVRRVKREADKTRSNLRSHINGAEWDHFSDEEDFSYYIRSCYEDAIAVFQMLSKELDDACRPLLYKNPGPEAVRAVRDLLTQLREDQYVEERCSGGIWGETSRVTIRVSFRPNTDSRMAARYWERCYENMPEARELEARERRQKEEAKQKAREAEEAAAREKEAQIARERNALLPKVEKKKKEVRARLKNAEDNCRQLKAQLEAAVAEDERTLQELRTRRESLGFFQFSEKKELAQQIREQQHQSKLKREELEKKEAAAQNEIEKLKQILTMCSSAAGGKLQFGRQYHNIYASMQWIIVSNDGARIRLMAEQTVECMAYGPSVAWLNKEFLNRSFSDKERAAMKIQEQDGYRQVILHPTGEDLQVLGSDWGTTPEAGLAGNLSEYFADKATRYFLSKKSNSRSGFDNCVTTNCVTKKWVTGTIGSGARLGIRPVICLELEKLLDIA